MIQPLWWDEADPDEGEMPQGSLPRCTAKVQGRYCGAEAVAAVHQHTGHGRLLPTILIRPDHLERPELARAAFRCVLCLHHDIDVALLVKIEETT